MTDPVNSLTQITWQSLTSIIGVGDLLIVTIEVLKRLKIICGTRMIVATGFLLGQILAQIAFWRCAGCSAQNITDAALVGFVGAIIGIGGHSIARKLLANGNGGDASTVHPPPPSGDTS